jgi:hypothetical protein
LSTWSGWKVAEVSFEPLNQSIWSLEILLSKSITFWCNGYKLRRKQVSRKEGMAVEENEEEVERMKNKRIKEKGVQTSFLTLWVGR